ncbi:MAG: hydrogenase expression/formation protein HypE [Sandaracinaceae bacterium]|nr:hydrogenase expression/formation protein HypE [Sandaracinaceae bacterium]
MSSELVFGACPAPLRDDEAVTMGHGSGGRLSAELVERLLVPAFDNPALAALDDQAVLPLPAAGRLALTTDSYVVSPIVFPGGDIGELAVNGTINDLAAGGAGPLALTFALVLEEGLPMADLRRVVESAARAAARAGVPIVTGDTKVVGRGSGDGVFVNTTGVGVVPPHLTLGSAYVRPGDAVLVSGTVGDHGVAILATREGLALEGDVRSDTAALHGLSAALLEACPEVHAMRDPTRGGLAAALVEIASRRGLGVEIEEAAVPIDPAVRGACELFGLDPMMIANEGKMVVFVPEARAGAALEALRAHPLGRRAARIGRVTDAPAGRVSVRTAVGGARALELPLTEPLPRIC